MIQQLLAKVCRKTDLSEEESQSALGAIMDGNASDAQIGALLMGLRMKGESPDEICGCAKAMRQRALRIDVPGYSIDTCGTGGDGAGTFNISTASALVAAAAGVQVCKHGNRAVSSSCGSADVLEALGVNLQLTPAQVAACVAATNIGFIFAPTVHLAMKNVAQPRKQLGLRTIFNILGPLTNPAQVKGQVLGVFDPSLTEVIAAALSQLGVERALVVHGEDGLDEITLCAKTKVSQLRNGQICTYTLDPKEYGFTYCHPTQLTGGTAAENATIILDIFAGAKGPKRDIVLCNAAAAIFVGGKASSIADGLQQATAALDSGMAQTCLRKFIEYTKGLESA